MFPQYGFKLEKGVLSGQQSRPSCPPYWSMSGGVRGGCRDAHRSTDAWGPGPRPRSHSLNSTDARWLHQRTVRFLISDSEDEDGYCEDNEGSSSEDASRRIRSREPPRGDDAHPQSHVHHCRRRSAPSLRESRQPMRVSEQQRPQLEFPKRNSRKRERSLTGRIVPHSTAPARPSPCRLQLQQQQQQRPSSAGVLVKNRRQVRPFCPRSSNWRPLDILSLPPSSPGPEVERLVRTFLRLCSGAAVGSQPGGERTSGHHHREWIPFTHSHPGPAEDRLPQRREGRRRLKNSGCARTNLDYHHMSLLTDPEIPGGLQSSV